jgi:predicted  nucleic acid-binding Zn-ribbon protein
MRIDHHHTFDLAIVVELREANRNIRQLNKHLENIMTAIQDLNKVIADLSAAINDATTEIEALLAKITNPGTSDADVEAAAASIQGIVTGLNQEVAKAKATAP